MTNKKPTIRQKIASARMDEDTRILTEAGIISDKGNLTSVGRRVLADVLFEENKAEIVELVKSTLTTEK